MRWLVYWGPALAWAALIWIFSGETFAADSTSRFLLPLLGWLLPDASPETLAGIHFAVRKLAHFGAYFVLALLLYRALRAKRGGWQARWAIGAFLLAVAYAAADELHQATLDTRTGSAADVLLDAAGAAAALLALRGRSRRKSQEEK